MITIEDLNRVAQIISKQRMPSTAYIYTGSFGSSVIHLYNHAKFYGSPLPKIDVLKGKYNKYKYILYINKRDAIKIYCKHLNEPYSFDVYYNTTLLYTTNMLNKNTFKINTLVK